jgi:hypothetical protein
MKRAVGRHGFNSILKNIQHDLFELVAIRVKGTQMRRPMMVDLNGSLFYRFRQDLQGFL